MERSYRQRIVDEYLNATGRNQFVPAEFLDWLEPQEGHRAWRLFFGKDDEEAAREYRISLARSFVAGLRISIVVSEVMASRADHMRLAISEPVRVRLPAFVSPLATRETGGGYIPIDADDGSALRELYEQGANDLARWIERYEGTARLAGADVAPLASVVGALKAAATVPE